MWHMSGVLGHLVDEQSKAHDTESMRPHLVQAASSSVLMSRLRCCTGSALRGRRWNRVCPRRPPVAARDVCTASLLFLAGARVIGGRQPIAPCEGPGLRWL